MKNVLLIIASCCSLLFCNGLNCCFSKEQDNVLVCKSTDGDMICYIGSQKSEYQKSEPRRNYLTIKEYENKDYINIRNVHLPEYELRDSSMADLISRFIEAEKHQQYYDKDGYILLCKETPAIWTFMSIFPNMYSFSDYGSYDGVMHFVAIHLFCHWVTTSLILLSGQGKVKVLSSLRQKKVRNTLWQPTCFLMYGTTLTRWK